MRLAHNVHRLALRHRPRDTGIGHKNHIFSDLRRSRSLAGWVHFKAQPEGSLGNRSGCYLTTLFGNIEITTAAPIDAQPPRRKRGWLPLLTVLFCLSYGLMTMLIVEQGRTIESQRALIRELFRDSIALNGYRAKELKERHAAKNAQTPNAQAPGMQTPSTQAQTQSPSSQAVPQHQNLVPKQLQPARPATDRAIDRRALIRI
jgi:hypothetical protein